MVDRKAIAVRLGELEDGQEGDCFALLAAKEERQTRAGDPYFQLTFRDRGREVKAHVWNNSTFFAACEGWKAGGYYKLRGQYTVHPQWGPQISLRQMRPVTEADRADGFDPAGFTECSRFDVDEMFERLGRLASEQVQDPALRLLVTSILMTYEAGIKTIPAATHNHHCFRGGYLEHTVSVVETCIFLATKYERYYADLEPPLDKDVVIAGAILHDIGKLRELEYQPTQSTYTPEGMLVGHVLLGRDIVREAAATIAGLDREKLLRLEHVIVSHHGAMEFGAARPPATPEAILVHYADNIDAKYQMVVGAIMNDPAGGLFSEKRIDGRRIYRGGLGSE